MGIIEILLIAVGLAMDAFAVSICKGLSMKKLNYKTLIIGLYFGLFQALMPLIGYLLGTSFESLITKIDHWIAFALLSIIGINMIVEIFEKEEEKDDKVNFKTMIPLAIATSIDALAIGITLAFLNTNIILPVIIIGLVTLILSIIGVIIGYKFGHKFEKQSQIIGGIILIVIGLKILLEHLKII